MRPLLVALCLFAAAAGQQLSNVALSRQPRDVSHLGLDPYEAYLPPTGKPERGYLPPTPRPSNEYLPPKVEEPTEAPEESEEEAEEIIPETPKPTYLPPVVDEESAEATEEPITTTTTTTEKPTVETIYDAQGYHYKVPVVKPDLHPPKVVTTPSDGYLPPLPYEVNDAAETSSEKRRRSKKRSYKLRNYRRLRH